MEPRPPDPNAAEPQPPAPLPVYPSSAPAEGALPAYPTPSPAPGQVPYAQAAGGLYGRATGPRSGFWKRVGATLLDGLILGVPFVVLIVVAVGAGGEDADGNPTNGALFGILGAFGLYFVASFLYQALLEGGPRGQTIGKRAAGIRVIDARTGGSIGYPRGFGRAGAKLLFSLLNTLFYLGFLDDLWMLWDAEKQTLHDKMVGSYVVPISAYPVE